MCGILYKKIKDMKSVFGFKSKISFQVQMRSNIKQTKPTNVIDISFLAKMLHLIFIYNFAILFSVIYILKCKLGVTLYSAPVLLDNLS